MSGFDEYVKTGLIKSEKKESAFEAWYKENEADIEEEYQAYVKDTEHLGDKPMVKKEWAKEIFESQTVEEKKKEIGITKSESVSPASFIDKILTEKKESGIKQYPELMEIAKKIAKDASIQMNELTKT